MRIGVDVSCWPNRRGYGRYTRELLQALVRLDQQNEYLFFLSEETARQCTGLPSTERTRLITVATSEAPTDAASASGRRSIRDVWSMARAVRRYKSELDLFYFPSVYTFFPLMSRVKTVVTIHDAMPERYPDLIFPNWSSRQLWNWKVRCAVWQSDLIATVSETARREITERFRMPESSVKIIPDAVSPTFCRVGDGGQTSRLAERYGFRSGEPVILYVGGISPHKNLATLIDAYDQLIAEEGAPRVRLVIVGDLSKDVFHSSYAALSEQVERLGLRDNVIFTGFVPDSDLVHLYNDAIVLALPSFDEGFGLPALEAMACGTPVVASRAGALPEVVGEGGLFFDPHSSDQLKAALRAILTDAPLREQLSRNALERAQAFSWDQSAMAARTTFESLVAHGDNR